jgi:DNA polymerase-3 subunit gamma/tau
MSRQTPPSSRASQEESHPDKPGKYLVVARRYRPRTFEELIGQQHTAQALRNSILANRVGHAYLFTGARGVGKTSAARIFAKALNCVQGPTPTPDNTCDICLSIDAGEDVDVLEIDGASNRGIEEIRQLRSNVNVRPSRALYKIYIIDEVHMLTPAAFNALLKTLEEPPAHVKFIFCTTDPEKIPITVLSRCQRFDFAPIETNAIAERLQSILEQEGRVADEQALALLARRAAGSMRDSQSLLEQLLAFCGERITAQDVYALLGAADISSLEELADRLLARDAGGALTSLDTALKQGAEAGHLAEQLLAYFRDMLVAAAGGTPDLALQVDEQGWSQVGKRGSELGLEKLMAIAQILDQTLVRMRQSTHGRVLLELAVVRITALERLDDLDELISGLRQGTLPGSPIPAKSAENPSPAAATATTRTPPSAEASGAEKKTRHPAAAEQTGISAASLIPLQPENVPQLWRAAVAQLEGILGEMAASAANVAIIAPNRLAVCFPAGYNLQKEGCERPDRKSKIEEALRQLTGSRVSVDFQLIPGDLSGAVERAPARSPRQLMRETERHELVSRAIELFDAEVVRVDVRRDPGRDAL